MALAKRKMRQVGISPHQEVIGLATEFLLIRHAPSHPPGHLYGRTDVAADVTGSKEIAAIRQAAGVVTHWVSSPALRCRQTLTAIWGDAVLPTEDPRLWEQDFGEWDGLSYADVPDLGALPPNSLAHHRPPAGESFKEVCDRVQPALRDIAARTGKSRVVIVAHAGVVRAAIALSFAASTRNAAASALSFDVQPLSLTVLHMHAADAISIACTNWRPSCT